MMTEATGPTATPRQLAALLLLLAASVLTGFGGRSLIVQASTLFPDRLPPHLYLAGHPALLYLGVPIVVLAMAVTMLAPGMLAVLALGGAPRCGLFILKSFGAALVLRLAGHAAIRLLAPHTDPFWAFFAPDLALDGSLAALAIRRFHLGRLAWPFAAREDRRRIILMSAMPVVFVWGFLPALLWQDLNSDAIEALELGWSLLTHDLPRLPQYFDLPSLKEGMVAMAFPVHWFIALLGPLEVAARLPVVLYLPLLLATLMELIEWNGARRMRAVEEVALLAALAAYAVAMGFNSTYDPYSADLACLGAAETLTVICMAATILFTWNGEIAWLVLFAVLGLLARPTQVMIMLALVAGVAMAGGEQRRTLLYRLTLAFGACIATYLVYEKILIPHQGLPQAGGDSDQRIRYLTFLDWSRLGYVAVPGGILPFLSLGFWKWQDRPARQVTIVTLLYFAFFYSQAFVALHHFAPAIILPMIVLWRTAARVPARFPAPLATGLALLSLGLSLPRHLAIVRTARQFGCELSYGIGNYRGRDYAARRAATARRYAMAALFEPLTIDRPDRDLRLSYLALIYYATQCRTPASAAQYVVEPASAPAPAGAVRIQADSLTAIFVRDTTQWRTELHHPPRTDWRSSLYATPITTLQARLGIRAHAYQLDLASLPGLWRLF